MYPMKYLSESEVGGKKCSYIDFRHQDVSNASQHCHKVKHVPSIL